jgi:hypothetical protein
MADKKRLNRWDRIMMAITFAEAGEAETAREILDNTKQKRPGSRIEKQNDNRPELRV